MQHFFFCIFQHSLYHFLKRSSQNLNKCGTSFGERIPTEFQEQFLMSTMKNSCQNMSLRHPFHFFQFKNYKFSHTVLLLYLYYVHVKMYIYESHKLIQCKTWPGSLRRAEASKFEPYQRIQHWFNNNFNFNKLLPELESNWVKNFHWIQIFELAWFLLMGPLWYDVYFCFSFAYWTITCVLIARYANLLDSYTWNIFSLRRNGWDDPL